MSTKSSTDAVLIDERAIKNNLTHSLAFFCLDSPNRQNSVCILCSFRDLVQIYAITSRVFFQM